MQIRNFGVAAVAKKIKSGRSGLVMMMCLLLISTSCDEENVRDEIDGAALYFSGSGDVYTLHVAVPMDNVCVNEDGYEDFGKFIEKSTVHVFMPYFYDDDPSTPEDERAIKWDGQCVGRTDWTYTDSEGVSDSWDVLDCMIPGFKWAGIETVLDSSSFEFVFSVDSTIPKGGGILGKSRCFTPQEREQLKKAKKDMPFNTELHVVFDGGSAERLYLLSTQEAAFVRRTPKRVVNKRRFIKPQLKKKEIRNLGDIKLMNTGAKPL